MQGPFLSRGPRVYCIGYKRECSIGQLGVQIPASLFPLPSDLGHVSAFLSFRGLFSQKN